MTEQNCGNCRWWASGFNDHELERGICRAELPPPPAQLVPDRSDWISTTRHDYECALWQTKPKN